MDDLTVEEFYKNNGYIIVPGSEFLSNEEHISLLEVSERLTNNIKSDDYRWKYNSNGTINKLEGAVLHEPQFLKLAKNKRLIQIAQSISNLGSSVDCYISKFFPQQKEGSSTLWHQDNYYFKGSPDNIVSCAVYLTDTNKENGCLRIAKDTHNLKEFLPHTSSSGMENIKWISDDIVNQYEIVDLIQTGPYAVFFNINIAHGCYTNTTDSNRYSLAWEYIDSSNTDVVNVNDNWCDRTLVTTKNLL